jgi:hypothetical protein
MFPVRVLALKFRMHQAVGASIALMIFIVADWLLAYIYYGLNAITNSII